MKTLKNNKGFTLIEIVIVIVIIAILAAMLVPSMLSWIDSANQRTFLSAADTVKTSILTTISEQYATGGVESDGSNINWTKVSDLAGETVGASGCAYNVTDINIANNKLTKMVITNDSYTVTYTVNTTTGEASWSEVTAVS